MAAIQLQKKKKKILLKAKFLLKNCSFVRTIYMRMH